jgi:hypothetical protein
MTIQNTDQKRNSGSTTTTTTTAIETETEPSRPPPPSYLSPTVNGGDNESIDHRKNAILDELSRSMHNASGRNNQECWPTVRMSWQEQDSWIVTQTRRTIDTLRRDSTFFDRNPPRPLPNFQDTELDIGKVIGNGEFGMVFEVNGFTLPSAIELAVTTSGGVDDGGPPSTLSSPPSGHVKFGRAGQDEFPTSLNNDEARCFMRGNALRDGVARFAVKVGSVRVFAVVH